MSKNLWGATNDRQHVFHSCRSYCCNKIVCVVSIIKMQCSSGSNHRIFVQKQVLILFVIGKHMASPLGDSFPFRPPLAESANVSGGVKVPFV